AACAGAEPYLADRDARGRSRRWARTTRSTGRSVLVSVAIALIATATPLIGQTFGVYTSTTSNSGNNFAAATDYRAPTQNRSVIAKSAGGTPGFIKQGGTYFVYSDLVDTGSPACWFSSFCSGSWSVTSGATATALSSGGFSVNGVSY